MDFHGESSIKFDQEERVNKPVVVPPRPPMSPPRPIYDEKYPGWKLTTTYGTDEPRLLNVVKGFCIWRGATCRDFKLKNNVVLYEI